MYNFKTDKMSGFDKLIGAMLIVVAFMVLPQNASGTELNANEKAFWDEAKIVNTEEMYKIYKLQYPSGVFERIADYKIKKLKDAKKIGTKTYLKPNGDKVKNIPEAPAWFLQLPSVETGCVVGNSNKHFKGEVYTKNLAVKRALRKDKDLSTFELEIEYHTTERGRVYAKVCKDEYQ